MLALRCILSAALATSAASASIFAPAGELVHHSFMKRENISVGSPLYNCHDNCGEAILEAQNCNSTVNVCDDETFLSDYQNCLQCSGPDNNDIWQWYGPSLEDTAESCGLSTSPLNGTQDSVSAAITASNSTSACKAAVASASSTASSTATGTSASASASATGSSSANGAPTADFAAYGAIFVAALCAMAI